ncbi:MAG: hypothetical protein ACREDD_02730 [Methylocella sp.]
MTRREAERIAWMIGSAALVGTAIGWIFAPAAFPYAWLAALTAWLGWPIGCMGLLLIHALTGGAWGYATRPQLVAGMTTLQLLPPALIPLIIVAPALYSWLRPEVAAHLDNGFYLNSPFFAARTIVYLIVWFGLSLLVLRALRQEGSDLRLARIAPAGLILLAITVTFAAIDTTMSLDPHFVSSAYGLIAIAEMGLLALSVSIFAAVTGEPPDTDTLRSLGQLLLGLLILWAYLDFMQLLIIWQSDLPKEAAWYAARWTGGWAVAAGFVGGGHFLLPFFALLSPKVQSSRRGIAWITALLILSEIVRSWWLVVPASGKGFGIVDVLAMLGVIGIAAALALGAPLMPPMPQQVRRDV